MTNGIKNHRFWFQKTSQIQVFIVFLGLAVFLLAVSMPVTAQNLGERTESSVDALRKAYSFDQLEHNDDMPGIGVLISYGRGNGISAKVIGDQFVKEFNRRGYRARYFYYNADWEGMTVEYHIGYSVLGPWDADSAALQVSAATKRADAAQNVHKSVKG